MISTTTLTKKKVISKIFKTILVVTFWIFLWEATTRIVSHNNNLLLLILPSPFTVLKKWTEIVFTNQYIYATLITLLRVFSGFVLGVLIGFVLGIVTHISKIIYTLLSPIIKIIRAVPVVAIIILLYLFFSSTTLPILIVCLMVTPIIWQTVHDSLNNTDTSLLEMAHVFNLSNTKKLLNIKLPYIMPNFLTSCVNALGLAWKSGVAAEVICLPSPSLGTLLWQGKGEVNYDEVYAITLTVIVLSIIIEFLLKFLCEKYILKGGITND